MISPYVIVDYSQLAAFCRHHGVARLSLFGSALRHDFDPSSSDVDILVEFLPGVSRSLFKLVAMRDELQEMLDREVDLTTPASLSKYIRQRVLSSAEVLYEAA